MSHYADVIMKTLAFVVHASVFFSRKVKAEMVGSSPQKYTPSLPWLKRGALRDGRLDKVGKQKSGQERGQNKMKLRSRWIMLTSALLLLLCNLALVAPTAWAHQRVQRMIAPPPNASPSVSIQIASPEYQAPTGTNEYIITAHNVVTGASSLPQGQFLVTRLIVASQTLPNGDLPDITPTIYVGGINNQDGYEDINSCNLGGSTTIGTPGASATYPACLQSDTNADTLDYTAPAKGTQTGVPNGAKWIQVKMFLLPQLPYNPASFTSADWLRMRIGESPTKYLPSLQNPATPATSN
jgi:hypothetical protein